MKHKKYNNLANSTIKVVASENLDISDDLNNNQYKSIAELYEEENSEKNNEKNNEENTE